MSNRRVWIRTDKTLADGSSKWYSIERPKKDEDYEWVMNYIAHCNMRPLAPSQMRAGTEFGFTSV